MRLPRILASGEPGSTPRFLASAARLLSDTPSTNSMTSTFVVARPGTARGTRSGAGAARPSGRKRTAACSFSMAWASWRKSSSPSRTSPNSEKTT